MVFLDRPDPAKNLYTRIKTGNVSDHFKDKAQGTYLSAANGNGDVLEPKDGLMAIGSGGNYALAAARALYKSKLTAEEIAKQSLEIAADLCIYTNDNIIIEKIT